jgi:hypothetical protein
MQWGMIPRFHRAVWTKQAESRSGRQPDSWIAAKALSFDHLVPRGRVYTNPVASIGQGVIVERSGSGRSKRRARHTPEPRRRSGWKPAWPAILNQQHRKPALNARGSGERVNRGGRQRGDHPRQYRSDYMPSAKKARDFVFFIRFASMSFWLGSFWKALAFSILSNAIMIIRFGGVPSMAVMLSVLAT